MSTERDPLKKAAQDAPETPKPLPRVRQVSARSLVDFGDTRELAQVMLDAIQAHKHLYEDANVLHGDINPNTIVILKFSDDDPAAQSSPSFGALIKYDEPVDINGKPKMLC